VDIAILIFDRITALDAVGPYQVLGKIPGATVTFVASTAGPKRTDDAMLGLIADAAVADLPRPDVVLVPGGVGQVDVEGDEAVIAWLQAAHRTTTWTTSVCTGALVLAKAGLLDGVRATTFWMAKEELRRRGAVPVDERVVVDGKIMTAAGVSSGIDMGLRLAAELAGEDVAKAIQLGIEYDPQPPFDAGAPEKSDPAVVELLLSRSRFAPTS
jgi:transcriptional regulator GlxA family with amidase domain